MLNLPHVIAFNFVDNFGINFITNFNYGLLNSI